MATVLKSDRPQTTAQGNGLKWIGKRPLRPDGVDKVTGRARFGADISLPGMLVGKVLRSPLPHARLKSIDIAKAAALPGVKAVITRDDFQDLPSEFVPAGEMLVNYRDMVRNVLAREKVLYEGHAVAAVAATSAKIAKEALKLIEVEYEPLPHVIDVVEAMADDAPLLHEDMFTAGVEPAPDKPSNVSKRVEFALGDTEAGFAQAEIIVERTFDTKPVHQGYIEPHACIASFSEDGQAELWCCDAGPFHRARPLRQDARHGHRQAARRRVRDRGRLRRQDGRLSRAARARALAQVASPGQDGDDARGGVPRHRPDLRGQRLGQGRGHQRRPDHRRRGGTQVSGGRVPGRAGAAGRDERVRALRPRARQGGRLRRGDQPAEGRGVSRARRADLRVRGRVRDGRAGQDARHGPGRVSPEERGQRGDARRLWAQVRPRRPDRHARGDQRARPLPERRSGRARAAASRRASGSTSAARPRPRST